MKPGATDYVALAQAAAEGAVAFETCWAHVVHDLRAAAPFERAWRLAELQRDLSTSEGDELARQVSELLKREISQ